MPKRRVKVYAEMGKSTPIYSLDCPVGTPKGGQDRLDFEGRDWILQFEIQPNNLGLRFKKIPTDAFWASISGCPTTPSQVSGLEPRSVDHNGQVLKVKNKNRDVQQVSFSLNFEGEDGGLPRRYDPIIDNRNGAHEVMPISIGVVIGAVVAGAAGALIGLSVLLRFKRGRR